MTPKFFSTQSAFRKWLEKNHAKAEELWVGFYRTNSGKKSITWTQAVDEALCFGWIDGIRKSLDEVSYLNRLTPRKPRSNWSAKNIKRAEELSALGLMHPAGLAAFEKRDEKRSRVYSFEQESVELNKEQEKSFRKNKKAWKFFQLSPPSYQRPAKWWVISAKQEETRIRRLEMLIDYSEKGERLPHLRPIKVSYKKSK